MCHVLIIEDEPLIAFDLQDLVEANGATSVAIAKTQAQAIVAARLHRPDIITSDVTLREGTGPEAVEMIFDEAGPMPVIFITATPEACSQCSQAAVILGKPLRYREIAATFRQMAANVC